MSEAISTEPMNLLERLELCAAWHKPGGPTPDRTGYGGVYDICVRAKAEIERLERERAELLQKLEQFGKALKDSASDLDVGAQPK